MPDICLKLTRSGGFGGLPSSTITLNTAEHSASSAEEIAQLVAAAAQSTVDLGAARPVIADSTSYDLTIRKGETEYHIRFDDVRATPELRRLVEHIQTDGISTRDC